MSRTPFDTTRLDEECERIARDHPRNTGSPYDEPIFASEVKALLLGWPMPHPWEDERWREFAIETFDMVRRPKVVRA